MAPASVRDPLMVSLSRDGIDWSVCKIAQTCTAMAGGASKCGARQKANGNVGPSYPQGLSVVAPAPVAMQGLYVVATNNKVGQAQTLSLVCVATASAMTLSAFPGGCGKTTRRTLS